ncbi:D-hexose-6-phosphate mutarotase [Alteromonas sp. C1M14]|uniref:D-hexose-6-phosphate mutarotase n=1 Tax=Alteromonas sp. C1M14 TaxID=2841567 RepID=UPI001C08983C|nr:D-hexose-6-phosphate mutarotase [Alteromonas sp. C1M14]MBU2977046.1 D-hexose-6-phosphate mutarotase [Alteromonas sp. C1M14]
MSLPATITVEESAGITFLNVENAFASSRISLYGAHVLSFTPKTDNQNRLWLSPHAYLNGERPIRGGIPICWPWFSDDHGEEKGTLPSHGFLRTQVWQIQLTEETEAGTRIVLSPSYSRGEGFEYDCTVSYDILVGKQLSVTLRTQNSGVVPFTFNGALHTYFAVPDITQTSIMGIEGDYKDKLESWAVKPSPTHYIIEGETDRIHQHPSPDVTIADNNIPLTRVTSMGNDSMVVWNPWQGAASIADMDAFGFKHMLCVETAITNGITLAPGQDHLMTQIVAGL